jgi:hypothetical protein
MPELRPHRSPWRDFPDSIVQTTVNKLCSCAAYDKAKQGLGKAAFEVIQELFKPEKIRFDFDTVVPVMQFDRAYPNALPIAYAIALAKHFEADLELEILQADIVSHTAADVETRILGQPVYIGKLQRGSRILIVDDVITFGFQRWQRSSDLQRTVSPSLGSLGCMERRQNRRNRSYRVTSVTASATPL